MSIKKIILTVIAIELGAFLFVFSEYDDSPGGQLLGLIMGIAGILYFIKSKKKHASK